MSVETIHEHRYPEYAVHYSIEDRQWVATTPEFRSLSWLADTESEAIAGLAHLVNQVQADIREHGA